MAQDIEALAHEVAWLKNNFKQYVAGNTYNGVPLTVTGSNSWVTTRATFRPFKNLNGSIEIDYKIAGTTASTSTLILTISGISIYGYNGVNYPSQHVGVVEESIGTWSRSHHFPSGAGGGVNQIYISAGSAATSWALSGTWELLTWPTFADNF